MFIIPSRPARRCYHRQARSHKSPPAGPTARTVPEHLSLQNRGPILPPRNAHRRRSSRSSSRGPARAVRHPAFALRADPSAAVWLYDCTYKTPCAVCRFQYADLLSGHAGSAQAGSLHACWGGAVVTHECRARTTATCWARQAAGRSGAAKACSCPQRSADEQRFYREGGRVRRPGSAMGLAFPAARLARHMHPSVRNRLGGVVNVEPWWRAPRVPLFAPAAIGRIMVSGDCISRARQR